MPRRTAAKGETKASPAKTRRKRRRLQITAPNWLDCYGRVASFEAHGGHVGPSIEVVLDLLEQVPQITSLALTVYVTSKKDREAWRPPSADPEEPLRAYVHRKPGVGSVEIAFWWAPEAVQALLAMLSTGRELFFHVRLERFRHHRSQAISVGWYTAGQWQRDVVADTPSLAAAMLPAEGGPSLAG